MHNQNDLHAVEDWTVDMVLKKQAQQRGDKKAIVMVDGPEITFAEIDRATNQVARLLLSSSVKKHDKVAVFLRNNLAYCLAWFGISRLGAVHVAINTEYKGAFLAHVLNNSRAELIICENDFLERLADIEMELPHLKTVMVPGLNSTVQFNRLIVTSFEAYQSLSEAKYESDVSYRDTASIMYTSGTTGPSKGVLMPHAHIYLFGLGTIENMRLASDDVYYIVLPLFHANGMFMQLYGCLISGATAVVKPRFSASEWILDIQRYGATITNSLGVISAFILKQPERPEDKTHRLHTIGVAPNTAELEVALKERYGVDHVIGMYGMTEVNIPLYTRHGISKRGSRGRVWEEYFELKIVDPDTDEEVARNEIGEIVVRPKQPYGFMAGYNEMPEKTVEAWRNFWFHTGDAAQMDEDGYVTFVDRIKDCIRRRGENISSFEVEAIIDEHPAVAESAAIAVKSEIAGGEDEVKVVVVLKPGQSLAYTELMDHCAKRMPRFAVPRFVEFVSELPKTPTSKVRKVQLRNAGITSATWDRQNQA